MHSFLLPLVNTQTKQILVHFPPETLFPMLSKNKPVDLWPTHSTQQFRNYSTQSIRINVPRVLVLNIAQSAMPMHRSPSRRGH